MFSLMQRRVPFNSDGPVANGHRGRRRLAGELTLGAETMTRLGRGDNARRRRKPRQTPQHHTPHRRGRGAVGTERPPEPRGRQLPNPRERTRSRVPQTGCCPQSVEPQALRSLYHRYHTWDHLKESVEPRWGLGGSRGASPGRVVVTWSRAGGEAAAPQTAVSRSGGFRSVDTHRVRGPSGTSSPS